MTRQLGDGVYINLPFEEYAEQDALGSTDKARLSLRRHGWWWSSRHNPYRGERKSTPEQAFGTALHAMLLEGPHVYDHRFCVKPERADHPNALTSIDAVKKAMREENVHLGSTTGWKAEDWYDAAEIYLPGRPVWDAVMADFERRQSYVDVGGTKRTRTAISAEDHFAIKAMREIATADVPGNEEVRELLSVGSQFPILSEVSVIATDELGVRHRARFDKLLPTAVVDLKSVGNWQGRELRQFMHRHIMDNGYSVQLADYLIMRQKAFDMVLEDPANLHGGTEEERTHFLAMAKWCADTHNKPIWAWLWYQRPSSTGNAPILLPLREEYGGPYHRDGFRKRHAALELYHQCMAEFGPDRPWGTVEAVHYTNEDSAAGGPHIFMDTWGWADDPAPGEEEAMRR